MKYSFWYIFKKLWGLEISGREGSTAGEVPISEKNYGIVNNVQNKITYWDNFYLECSLNRTRSKFVAFSAMVFCFIAIFIILLMMKNGPWLNLQIAEYFEIPENLRTETTVESILLFNVLYLWSIIYYCLLIFYCSMVIFYPSLRNLYIFWLINKHIFKRIGYFILSIYFIYKLNSNEVFADSKLSNLEEELHHIDIKNSSEIIDSRLNGTHCECKNANYWEYKRVCNQLAEERIKKAYLDTLFGGLVIGATLTIFIVPIILMYWGSPPPYGR